MASPLCIPPVLGGDKLWVSFFEARTAKSMRIASTGSVWVKEGCFLGDSESESTGNFVFDQYGCCDSV